MLPCYSTQLACEFLACKFNSVTGAALLAADRFRPERGVGVGDLVVDAVPRDRERRAVPALRVSRPVGALAEDVARPRWSPLDLTLGEVVPQVRVLAFERMQCRGEAVAFLADGGDVAELAAEGGALREDAFELILGTGECRGQPAALNDMAVLAAPDAAPW
jgi:hypothetical protein